MYAVPLVAVEPSAGDDGPAEPGHGESVEGLGQRSDLAAVAPGTDQLHGTREGIETRNLTAELVRQVYSAWI